MDRDVALAIISTVASVITTLGGLTIKGHYDDVAAQRRAEEIRLSLQAHNIVVAEKLDDLADKAKIIQKQTNGITVGPQGPPGPAGPPGPSGIRA